MDEASRLVAELQSKLAELDSKVLKYRQDMTHEFEKYAADLLRNVPSEISESVSKTIAESIKSYSSLNPTGVGAAAIESCAEGNHDLVSTTPGVSPIPTPLRKIAEDMLGGSPQRSPHEREKEFTGLFTPSYLPLLDSTNRNERRSSYPISPPALTTINMFENMDAHKEYVDGSTEVGKSLAPSPVATRPQTPKRRNTDNSEVSTNSDRSDGTLKRSALRRSSSASKGTSPRRVRFELEQGGEILPTASPADTLILSTNDGDLEEGGVEQIEDIAEEEPAPKRISSSQALRALSRSPLVDDGTEWTTVAAPPDGSASVETQNGFSRDSSDSSLLTAVPSNGSIRNAPAPITAEHEDETASDGEDDMLDMPPLKRHGPSTHSMLSPTSAFALTMPKNMSASSLNSHSPSPSKETENVPPVTLADADEDENDDLFDFEEATPLQTSSSKTGKYIDDIDEEDEDLAENSSSLNTPKPSASLSASVEPISLSYSRSPATKTPALPTKSLLSGSLSSYYERDGTKKTLPFADPIVSPELHKSVLEMGDVHTFVGSIHGRSGVDESDEMDYMGSIGVGANGGVPGSMSERLMMDEYLEAREKVKNGDAGRTAGVNKKG